MLAHDLVALQVGATEHPHRPNVDAMLPDTPQHQIEDPGDLNPGRGPSDFRLQEDHKVVKLSIFLSSVAGAGVDGVGLNPDCGGGSRTATTTMADERQSEHLTRGHNSQTKPAMGNQLTVVRPGLFGRDNVQGMQDAVLERERQVNSSCHLL